MTTLFNDLKIENPRCMGDQWHNEFADILNTMRRTKKAMRIKDYITGHLEDVKDHWLMRRFAKWEAKRLVAMANSKTEKTYEKRKLKYLLKLTEGYGPLLNKRKIELFAAIHNMQDLLK